VADGDDARKIEVMLRGDLAKVVGAVGNILKAAGPAATVVADAAVLDVPGCDAVGGEVGGDGAEEI
jgi:hypothetical protein